MLQRTLLKAILGFALFINITQGFAQVITATPNFPLQNSNVSIRFDASKGNKALFNTTNTGAVYVHVGVITNLSTGPSNWRYTKFTWGSTNSAAKATFIGSNIYTYAINNVRTFFAVPTNETILKIAIVFRNANGSVVAKNDDGSDMFIKIYPTGTTSVKFTNPPFNPYFIPSPTLPTYSVGQTIPVTGISSASTAMNLVHNGTTIASVTSGTTLNGTVTIRSTGNQTVQLIPAGNLSTAESFSFFVPASTPTLALPAGVRDGINYNADNTSVTLVLHAPGKNRVVVIGDFNNWTQLVSNQMNRTPDGQKFWITITGLTPGVEYGFQYLVDDNIRIADPYSEKILDPWNDPTINDVTGFTVYPNLKAYPTGKTTGYVGVFQTAKPVFNWTANSFVKPEQNKLLVYELHVRDYVATHSWKTLRDTLNYIQKLGINAIEIMPFNEFEGNDSWGYNPNFYNAPDKYYGTDTDLKTFIDECHKRGIAVIQDIVFNHAWSSCPLVQLYWDAVNSRPAANNPWFNTTAPHPYGFGNDFNFSSPATRTFFQRILEYWLDEYKIDGFRFDLSKGFTNKNTGTDVAAWGSYDAERVANIQWLADVVWNKNPGAYMILEHLGGWDEENVYMNYKQGMMPWHRLDVKFNEATMGWPGCGQDISEVYYRHNNNFSRPLRMGNLESHDEERLMYKNINFGNSTNTAYNAKTLQNGLKRVQSASAFHLLIPGPKMIWQFTELGYDYSINACSNGVLGVGDQCRTARKPIRWDYFGNPDRKALYDGMSNLMKLKKKFGNVFASDLSMGYDLGCSSFKFYQISHPDLNVTVMGNFDVTTLTRTITFQKTGIWTDFLTGNTLNLTSTSQSITLQPGESRIYLDQNITSSNIDAVASQSGFTVYFKKPTNWSTPIYIHYTNILPVGSIPSTTLPGVAMTPDCNDWFKFTFPSTVTSVDLTFRDAIGNQTGMLTGVNGNKFYDNGWLPAEPINRCAISNTVKLHFRRPASWTNIPKVYYWNTTPSLPSITWPGFDMTDEGNGWWGYTINGANCSNVIFNNNTAPQTNDLLNVCGEKWYDNGFVTAPISPAKPNFTIATTEKPSKRIMIYPNPAHEQIKLQLQITQKSKINISLYEFNGRLIKELTNQVFERGNQNISLPIQAVSKGMYMLIVNMGEQGVLRYPVMIEQP